MLLTSGFTGLSRISKTPGLYKLFSSRIRTDSRLISFKECLLKGEKQIHIINSGKPEDINSLIEKESKSLDKINTKIKSIEKKNSSRYYQT